MTNEQLIQQEAERVYLITQKMIPQFRIGQFNLQKAFTSGANFALSLNRWVKVEDGLPDASGRYLTITDNAVYICWFDLESKSFTGEAGYYDASAWQHLPMLPEGECFTWNK